MLTLAIVGVGVLATSSALAVLRLRDTRLTRAAASASREAHLRGEQQTADARFLTAVDRYGVPSAFGMLQCLAPWNSRRQSIESARLSADSAGTEATTEFDQRNADLTATKLPSSVPMVTMLLLFFGTLAWLNWWLDAELLMAQGHPSATAMLLGTVISMLIELLGLVVFAALGVHRVPLISNLGRNGKAIVFGASLTLLAVIVVGGIVPLAAGRTEKALGAQLRGSKATVEALASTGTTSEQTAAELALEDVQSRYDRSMRNDKLVAAALATGVASLSWAPVHAVEVAQLVACRRRKQRSSRAVAAVADERRRLDADLVGHAARILDAGGRNPADLEQLFAPLNGEPPVHDDAGPRPRVVNINDPGVPPPPATPAAPAYPGASPAQGRAGDGPIPMPPPLPTDPTHNPFDLFPEIPEAN